MKGRLIRAPWFVCLLAAAGISLTRGEQINNVALALAPFGISMLIAYAFASPRMTVILRSLSVKKVPFGPKSYCTDGQKQVPVWPQNAVHGADSAESMEMSQIIGVTTPHNN